MVDMRKVYGAGRPNRNGHQSPTATIKVGNTDPKPLRLFQRVFGGKVYREPELRRSTRTSSASSTIQSTSDTPSQFGPQPYDRRSRRAMPGRSQRTSPAPTFGSSIGTRPPVVSGFALGICRLNH